MFKILISGSIAYDYICTYSGIFQDEFPADKSANLNVALMVQSKVMHFGGCAGNIAYNGKLLGENFLVLGIAGKDFDEYEKWLKRRKIDSSNIIRVADGFTSNAMMVNDKKGQQLIVFHEGVAAQSAEHVKEIRKTIQTHAKTLKLALVSPNNKVFMMATMDACVEFGIPFIFDPGQAMAMFTKEDLNNILDSAEGLILNDHEFEKIKNMSCLSRVEILGKCRLVVVTMGEKGSVIYFDGNEIAIDIVKPREIREPTGCGDAYRAGFLATIADKFPTLDTDILKQAGNRGARLATACLENVGTQNHSFAN